MKRGLIVIFLVACGDVGGHVDAGGGDGAVRSDTAVMVDGAGPACDFATTYIYGPVGGNAPTTTDSILTQGHHYQHRRIPRLDPTAPTLWCAPPMPVCGAQDVITAYDIEVHDLPHPDVQRALASAQPPLYGYDPRPHDGNVFRFSRDDGRGFLAGDECESRNPCTPIPAGIRRLKKRLLDLDAQQTANPLCAHLR